MKVFLLIGVIALMCPAYAWPDGFQGYTDQPVKKEDIGPPPGFVNTPAQKVRVEDQPVAEEPAPSGRESSSATEDTPEPAKPAPVKGEPGKNGAPGPKGDKGDAGPGGPQGPQGIQGIPGVNADLCSNIDGIQTTPGWKIWPQRYWTFKPRKEHRYLGITRRGQIVCVTRGWIRNHGIRFA